MRSFVEQVKKFYDKGIYTKTQIDTMYSKGKITKAEYEYILSANS